VETSPRVAPLGALVSSVGDAEKEVVTASGKSHAVGHFPMGEGRLVISLDRQEASDPRRLTAIAVPELCHLRLLGEDWIRRASRTGSGSRTC
jgi:hypothetical protein